MDDHPPSPPSHSRRADPDIPGASPRPSRFSGRDAVTDDERRRQPADPSLLVEWEAEAGSSRPDQLTLFAEGPDGSFTPQVGGVPPLSPASSLDLARTWYRRELQLGRRPHNTVEAYSYDLMVLRQLIGPKPLNRIDRRDIAFYLGNANNRTTRKRRLTSVRRFFRYLIDDAKVLKFDPTEGYYPHAIQLRSPLPLFPDEQAALLDAAGGDEPWSAAAIWLMMRLGLTRAELLQLKRDHIDRTVPETPIVFVFYDDLTKQTKERRLAADAAFAALYDAYLEDRDPQDLLFPVGPQAVNGMVNRVRKLAGITKDVTPQTLRHTFAVEQARNGADQAKLLALLGLANDPRNRASVDRYLRLAAPPLLSAAKAGMDPGAQAVLPEQQS
ncbi:MAG TPA: tyrosine-type recombinase/integrase [Thermomicrobiales bacterium]|nr:tyrosine-type recombinase/integrase [Thermomicrobiales bacterium]